MSEGLVETFLAVEVAETRDIRSHWVSQDWVDPARRSDVAAATIIVLPTFDEDGSALYPTGAPAFVRTLREKLDSSQTVVVPTRPEDYVELLLHSREWRLPKLFVAYVAVPLLINLLSSKIESVLPGFEPSDTINLEMIVEGENHRCLAVKYKGPSTAIPEVVLKQIERCSEYLNNPKGVATK
jgi:hypothetical protein